MSKIEINKECLNCGKEYKALKPNGKFCSANCRVKWNRNKPEKGITTKMKIDFIYNALMGINSSHINSKNINTIKKGMPNNIDSEILVKKPNKSENKGNDKSEEVFGNKEMPGGLSRVAQMRWLRENS